MLSTEEVKKLLGIMTISFPNYRLTDPQLTADLWKEMFQDYSYNEVSAALKTFIATDTSGFAPSIGQVIDKIHSAKEMPSEISESAVWAQVMKALSNSTYNSVSEFEKLDDVAKRVIGSPESLRSMAMNSEFNEDVEKALFMKTYRAQMTRQKEINRMPSDVRNAIGIGNNNNIGGYIG